eukprot:TRINITY_DN2253_c0_g1_i1.p1 TRINITY_DN2253_c0_g1~~TRINITY_DN2253_c0_g1_i1.p1  ORF type:complete len:118 (+),score=0.87 TRINITY_DN2253_c0_g1_i1:29-355(+)
MAQLKLTTRREDTKHVFQKRDADITRNTKKEPMLSSLATKCHTENRLCQWDYSQEIMLDVIISVEDIQFALHTVTVLRPLRHALLHPLSSPSSPLVRCSRPQPFRPGL